MKKLSELPKETLLHIDYDDYDSPVMSKEDFLNDYRYLDKKDFKLALAVPEWESFEWSEVFESKADNMYEDWDEHVENDISAGEWNTLNKARDIINKVFKENPAYSSGEKIEIDM